MNNTFLHTLHSLTAEYPFNGLSTDSRTLQAGNLFFALNSPCINDHIDEAVQKGAAVIVCEKLPVKEYTAIPIIQVDNLSNKIGFFAAEYYHYPSNHLHIIGVTGTNGKTSCTHFIAQAFKMAGFKSAVIGTVGNGLMDHLIPAQLTTPDALSLQVLLNNFLQQKIDFVALEASSHGLLQGRLNGTQIETAIFTNLTREHLDYHHTMENYAAAKFRLFEHPGLKQAILNLDDPYGYHFAQQLRLYSPHLTLYGITINTSPLRPALDIPLISADIIPNHHHPHGLSARVCTPWGDTTVEAPHLLGQFNLYNLLCVLAVLRIAQISLNDIVTYFAHLTPPPGRMETFGGSMGKPCIVIDHAHTPDALSKTLQVLKEQCKGELWCVFGCGGDRDPGKRPEMGHIAEKFADQIILTDDNPRCENPAHIIADICKGFTASRNFMIEHDRRRAIQHAIHTAKSEDIVLIAGKGHETYQEINHQKTPFSDSLVVKLLLLE